MYQDYWGATVTDDELENQFEDYLNDTDVVYVLGFTFGAGTVLRDMDPIAFRGAYLDWVDSQVQDGMLVEL